MDIIKAGFDQPFVFKVFCESNPLILSIGM